MGNCAQKPKTKPQSPTLHLHGSESCPIAIRIRIILLYKSIPFVFVPTASSLHSPFLHFGSESVRSLQPDSLLRYIDSKFAGAPSLETDLGSESAAAVMIRMQHRSMERHIAVMERWTRVGDFGGKGRRMVGEWYGRLVEVMLEHAQMEEMFLFPLLESAVEFAVCRGATEEHGRDLPMMNGIKEDIKMLVVMEPGTPCYQEALLNLSLRLKKFQEHCREHFEEEEEKLLPLLEAAEEARREMGGEPWSRMEWAEKLMKLMEATHSPQLFPFFMSGLRPDEAMQYIGIVCRCTHDDEELIKMLRSIIGWFEGTMPLSWIRNTPFLK